MAHVSRSQGLMSGVACPVTALSLEGILGIQVLLKSDFDISALSSEIITFKNLSWDGILKFIIPSQY